jgi:hypothetical protein
MTAVHQPRIPASLIGHAAPYLHALPAPLGFAARGRT